MKEIKKAATKIRGGRRVRLKRQIIVNDLGGRELLWLIGRRKADPFFDLEFRPILHAVFRLHGCRGQGHDWPRGRVADLADRLHPIDKNLPRNSHTRRAVQRRVLAAVLWIEKVDDMLQLPRLL